MELEKSLKRTRPNILVTGTPGVGKSTLCKLLVDYVPDLKSLTVGKKISYN